MRTWRAANYADPSASVDLYDDPLLKKPPSGSHAKPLVVGHWGRYRAQNFSYDHLNRVIKKHDLDAKRPFKRMLSTGCDGFGLPPSFAA